MELAMSTCRIRLPHPYNIILTTQSKQLENIQAFLRRRVYFVYIYLAAGSVGPVTDRLLVRIPEPAMWKKSLVLPLSTPQLTHNCSPGADNVDVD